MGGLLPTVDSMTILPRHLLGGTCLPRETIATGLLVLDRLGPHRETCEITLMLLYLRVPLLVIIMTIVETIEDLLLQDLPHLYLLDTMGRRHVLIILNMTLEDRMVDLPRHRLVWGEIHMTDLLTIDGALHRRALCPTRPQQDLARLRDLLAVVMTMIALRLQGSNRRFLPLGLWFPGLFTEPDCSYNVSPVFVTFCVVFGWTFRDYLPPRSDYRGRSPGPLSGGPRSGDYHSDYRCVSWPLF